MKIISIAAFVVVFASIAAAQSGGPYQITQSVIAGGGGDAAGGAFALTGTLGQSTAGQGASGGSFVLQTGFWAAAPAAPTAATVTVAGRVLDAAGNPLGNVMVIFTDSTNSVQVVRTNAFGYFTFSEMMSGETYLVNLSAKGRQFVPQVITVRDSLTGLEFRAID